MEDRSAWAAWISERGRCAGRRGGEEGYKLRKKVGGSHLFILPLWDINV